MGTFTMATGFGMLAVGLIAMAIGATIFFMTVNRMEKNKESLLKFKPLIKLYDQAEIINDLV